MYDPRDTLKAVAVEALKMGQSIYIHSDGLVYLVDNTKSDVCHGWALKAYVAGDEVTILTACRMNVATAQTKGAMVYTGAVSGGSAPSTTHAADGRIVGFAMTAYKIYVRAPTPAANG